MNGEERRIARDISISRFGVIRIRSIATNSKHEKERGKENRRGEGRRQRGRRRDNDYLFIATFGRTRPQSSRGPFDFCPTHITSLSRNPPPLPSPPSPSRFRARLRFAIARATPPRSSRVGFATLLGKGGRRRRRRRKGRSRN